MRAILCAVAVIAWASSITPTPAPKSAGYGDSVDRFLPQFMAS